MDIFSIFDSILAANFGGMRYSSGSGIRARFVYIDDDNYLQCRVFPDPKIPGNLKIVIAPPAMTLSTKSSYLGMPSQQSIPETQWFNFKRKLMMQGWEDITNNLISPQELDKPDVPGWSDVASEVSTYRDADRLLQGLKAIYYKGQYEAGITKAKAGLDSYDQINNLVFRPEIFGKCRDILTEMQEMEIDGNVEDYIYQINEMLKKLYQLILRSVGNGGLDLIDTGISDPTLAKETVNERLKKEKLYVDDTDNYNSQNIESYAYGMENLTPEDFINSEHDPDIQITEADSKLKSIVQDMISYSAKLVNCWKVSNKKTEKRYLADLDSVDPERKEEELLLHGSPSKNWYNIVKQGLVMERAVAGRYGVALYFSHDVSKAMTYTSLKHANVGDKNRTGFVGIYKVRTGKRLDLDEVAGDKFNIEEIPELLESGYDSIQALAEGNQDNEVAIYKSSQCTIYALAEISIL